MYLIASDFYSYLRPSKCGLRIYLRKEGVEEAPESPYEELVKKLGEAHEAEHLKTLPHAVDMRRGTLEERAKRTIEAINKGAPAIYQGVFMVQGSVEGTQCEIVGDPDFLIKEDGDYVIRDAKLARRISYKDHPEIVLQLDLYGWLYENTIGRSPSRLEVFNGAGEIIALEYDGGRSALSGLSEILDFKKAEKEPYTPVGWSKCSGCGFFERCWPLAEKRRDPAILPDVDLSLASVLKDMGVESIEELVERFDEVSLSEVERPWGNGKRFVGIRRAERILLSARAVLSGKEIFFARPELPPGPHYVVFDLEGIPPVFDDTGKIYLWGMMVFGKGPGEFEAATSGFGPDGDRRGWEDFLRIARSIFDKYGDVPFIHWHSYEKTMLDMYVERFGDRDGTAARVRRNLFDLLPVTKGSVALPVPSYSLKAVERYIGYERTMDEYGGDWAMARYIEAVETGDEKERRAIMDDILRYNREDLEATWAVFRWLREKAEGMV